MSTEEKTVEEPKLETVQAAPRVQPAPRATHRHAETTAPRWTSLCGITSGQTNCQHQLSVRVPLSDGCLAGTAWR